MSFGPISAWLSTHWYTITIMIMITGVLSTSISYYAKAETEKIIQEEISKPFDKIEQSLGEIKKNQTDFEKTLTQQRIEVERQKEKLNGIENRLDLIIRMLDRSERPRTPNSP